MVDEYQALDLAMILCDIDTDVDDVGIVEDELETQYGIRFDDFLLLVGKLIKYTVPTQTAITGKMCRGFVKDGSFIIKEYVDE
jgi:hypothetical protein